MRIGVDAMGGDHAPAVVVQGVIEAVKEFDVNITLFGIQEDIEQEFQKNGFSKDRITIVHAPETIGMHEPATVSIRQKKHSSISVGIDALKNAEVDAFISAGNTGAVVAASTLKLRMLKGVERPAIGIIIPTLKNFSFLIDAGANTEPKPKHLLQSALMAKVYAKEVLGVSSPTTGLLNIGEEAGKGSGFEKEAYKVLEERMPNFIGNVEASEVYTGKSDCIVCDGFVGNVVLKVSEGLLESAGKLMKREIKKSPLAMMGALLMKMSMKKIRKLADYAEYGGAPLLGVNGVVMIGHGRSSPKAIKNAIKATIREIEHDILSAMTKEIEG
ncbi:MAG: phosphate acyltransferase PlsX [Candidatus Omnitrophica bacterium]|nr:phosphate acyltransferase PlsX [Candidatus Omnitrophota bacterium]